MMNLTPRCLLLALFVLSGCQGSQPLEDAGPIRRYQPESDVIVEMESRNRICVTEEGRRTCVPVVHEVEPDEANEESVR